MQVTVQVKMVVSREQAWILRYTQAEYVRTVNRVADTMIGAGTPLRLTSRDVDAALPSALRNQAILDAASVCRKARKSGTRGVLRKPVCIWNNQNWTVKEGILRFPVIIGGKCQRVSVPVLTTGYQRKRLSGKLGTLRITEKSGKWVAQIAVAVPEAESPGAGVMGVDLGLKCPAVAVTSTGKTRFFGNGRENKCVRRRFQSRRRRMGKLKKLSAIRRLDDKEQRWMTDRDHKVSRRIVDMAVHEGVGTIKLERLAGIRKTTRTSRKNAKNLHAWSFHRLARFIEYKAAMAGIRVEYVDPAYTSQACPACGKRNKVRGRDYRCGCGYRSHRDRVGAVNVMAAPVSGGNSLAA